MYGFGNKLKYGSVLRNEWKFGSSGNEMKDCPWRPGSATRRIPRPTAVQHLAIFKFAEASGCSEVLFVTWNWCNSSKHLPNMIIPTKYHFLPSNLILTWLRLYQAERDGAAPYESVAHWSSDQGVGSLRDRSQSVRPCDPNHIVWVVWVIWVF